MRAGVTITLAGILTGILTGIGAWLRFRGLAYRDFWFDESCTFIYVDGLFRWSSLSNLLIESTNLPYYTLLRGWVGVFGDSEAGYRSFSALCGTLTIPLLGWIGWRLGGWRTMIVCVALATFHPLHIHYSHEARAYALWVLMLALCMALLLEAARRQRWRWWVVYGVAVWFCMHLHYFTLFWIPGSLACAWLPGLNTTRIKNGNGIGYGTGTGSAIDRDTLRHCMIVSAAVLAAFLPYFLLAVLPAGRGGGSAWVAAHFDAVRAIPQTLWCMLPSGGYPAHLHGLSLASADTVRPQAPLLVYASRLVPAILFTVLIVVVLMRTLSSRDDGTPRPRSASRQFIASHLFLASLTLLPLCLAWGYSVLIRPTYLVGRYDLVALPAMVVWLAVIVVHGAQIMAPRRHVVLGAVLTASFIACSAVPIQRMAALQPSASMHRLRADALARLLGSNDKVITFSYDRDYLLYYLHRAGFGGSVSSFPSWLDEQVGWVDTTDDLRRLAASDVAADTKELLETIHAAVSAGRRVLILGDSMDRNGTGARSEINGVLLDRLQAVSYRLITADMRLGILEIVSGAKAVD